METAMDKLLTVAFLILPCVTSLTVINKEDWTKKYEPTWDSLDARPLPPWYDEVKIGIFIHWGVFSVPSYKSEWFWIDWVNENGTGSVSDFMRRNYPPGFTYQDFAKEFTAEFYNPDQWADIFSASGATYVVLTSKHHEGYTLWPSPSSFSWNAMDVGPHRDLLGELADSIRRRTDIKFGVYHSLFEWFNPLYLSDKANGFTTKDFVERKTIPELYELVNNYHPEVIWSDGDWEASEDYWGSKQFLTWLYNDSPVKDTVVVNDRWGAGNGCAHGGFFNCADRFSPGVLQPHKWENALTIDRQSWGFRRDAPLADYLTMEELINEIVKTVSCRGNVLINVGPTKEGTINPIFEERLRSMGDWLKINGPAIYATKPWTFQNDTVTPDVWYTKKDENVFAITLKWPENNSLTLTSVQLSEDSEIRLLGNDDVNLQYVVQTDSTVAIQLPDKSTVNSNWAYALSISNVLN